MTKRDTCVSQSGTGHDRAVRDGPERDDHCALFKAMDFCREILAAVTDLGPDRLVLRWEAFHRICHSAVQKREIIQRVPRGRCRRKTEFVQCFIKKNSRVISGERPTGCVGAVHAGRKTDDE